MLKSPLEALSWNNGTIVCLETDNVLEWISKAKESGLNIVQFYEPDIDKITGFACYCDGKLFKKLKLMGS